MKKLILPCLLAAALATTGSHAQAQRKSPVLNHMAFYVHDLQKSTAFYRDIIQIDTIPEPFRDGKHTWFKIGEHSQLHLIQGAKEITKHDRNTHICFSVPSMNEFIARLNRHNIDFTNWQGSGKTPTRRVDGVQQIYLTDPDGYWIEINDDKY